MTILFVMRHSGYVRNWEWVLRELASRGHRIHIGFEIERPQAEVADAIARDHLNVTYGYVPLRADLWRPLAYALKQGIDYLRYLTPGYEGATKLRTRARKGTPGILLWLTELPVFRRTPVLRLLDRVLRACERAIPVLPEIEQYVRSSGANVLMATPLVAGHSQHDYVRAARALGLTVIFPVNSWDNLTNKGLVREQPDRVYVWNETQRREAIDLHGVPADRVLAIGAHTFDHWFEWQPSTTREEFCARVGLEPKRPFVLYVCSSGFIAKNERPTVEAWAGALRSSGDPLLEEIGLLVRPHPSTGDRWTGDQLPAIENFTVWPREGADPRNKAAKSDYYDSMHHASAVVGINTSALIEAAIVGRRTYTILLPEFADTQEGTLHFHYLLRENGGPLTVAESLDEHVAQLGADVRAGDRAGWNLPFLSHFIRPRGLDLPCAPQLADDLESLIGAFRQAPELREDRRLRTFLLSLAWTLSVADRVPEEERGSRSGADITYGPSLKRRRKRRRMKRLKNAYYSLLFRTARVVLPSPARAALKERLRGRVAFLPAKVKAPANGAPAEHGEPAAATESPSRRE